MKTRVSLAIAGALASVAVLAASASAATVIGDLPPQQSEPFNCSPLEGVQDASGTGAPSYTVPADGVITSFRHQAGLGAPQGFAGTAGDAYSTDAADAEGDQVIKMKTWRATANPNRFTVAGASTAELLTPDQLNEFLTRVPVKAGDLLGLTTLTNGVDCAFSGVPGDHHFYNFDQDLAVGATGTFPGGVEGNRWNIEATVEPDADRDGYGDETQDQCPSDASTHGPCPPETTITYQPEFVHNPESRFRFRSSLAGSTFTCKMDGKREKPCSSPKVYRNLKTGNHTFRVYATSDAGVADPTPAEATFRVFRKAKKDRP